jgi:endonuclease/exonuclease/phosphatase family metal-dependent hydrolase
VTAEITPKDAQPFPFEKVLMVAIYAPATGPERKLFFEQLQAHPWINEHTTPTIILGDFNLDFSKREGRSSDGRWLSSNFLNLHNDLTTFNRGPHHSRIDYILVSEEVKNVTIKPKMQHSPIFHIRS